MKRTSEGVDFEKKHKEAFDKIAKAMELTHGKADNDLARQIAQVECSTAEDVARLGKGSRDYRALWTEDEYRGKKLKEKQLEEKKMFSFKDTFAYRYMCKLGIQVEERVNDRWGYGHSISDKNSSTELAHTFLTKMEGYTDAAAIAQFKGLMATPLEIREKVFASPKLVAIWTKGVKHPLHIPYFAEGFSTLSNDERKAKEESWMKKMEEKKAKEILMLSLAPEEIIEAQYKQATMTQEERNKASSCYRYSGYEYVSFADVWYRNERLETFRLEKELEIDDFYNSLNYMGIGIACMEEARYDHRKNIRQFVTHVNSITRRFVSDIKKGGKVELVRKLIIDDLNIWLKERVEDKWIVFALSNAKTSYDDIKVNGKKKVQTQEELAKKILEGVLEAKKEEVDND